MKKFTSFCEMYVILYYTNKQIIVQTKQKNQTPFLKIFVHVVNVHERFFISRQRFRFELINFRK
jgi:hypothetical protein